MHYLHYFYLIFSVKEINSKELLFDFVLGHTNGCTGEIYAMLMPREPPAKKAPCLMYTPSLGKIYCRAIKNGSITVLGTF